MELRSRANLKLRSGRAVFRYEFWRQNLTCDATDQKYAISQWTSDNFLSDAIKAFLQGSVHTTPEEIENRGFTLKTYQMFASGYFAVVSEVNSGRGILRSAHTRGLVPVTSPCNMSRGEVPSCELVIFATQSSRGD